MQYRFFALISRMRYIQRWGLMRNTFQENIQEHSHMVAVLAHGLASIRRDILHLPADPGPVRVGGAVSRRLGNPDGRSAHPHQILQSRYQGRLQAGGADQLPTAPFHAAPSAAR